MANHKWETVKTLGREKILVHGSFAPDTANPPTTLRGVGFSVVRTSQGLFTITFEDPFVALENVECCLQMAAATARWAQAGTYDGGAKTLQIRVIDSSGAVQDIAAGANNRINFSCILSNSANA